MKLDDRDLERALSPLAGRPADDFHRVMAALPEKSWRGSTGPGRLRRIASLIATAAAGIAIGCLIGIEFISEEQVKDPLFVAHDPRAPQLVAATSDVALETDTGPALLMLGSTVPFGHFVSTKGAALITLPGWTELRVGPDSRVSIDSRRSATLMEGLMFVHIPTGQGRFVVETLSGMVECSNGSFQVESRKSVVRVVAFEGLAQFTSLANEGRDLQQGESCEIKEGLVGPNVRPVSLWSRVEWQQDLLLRIRRDDELIGLLSPLVLQLGQKPFAAPAERQLRQAGELGAIALGYMLDNLDDGDLRQKCVLLLSQVAGYMSCKMLLPVLRDEHGESRAHAVEALERVTGIPSLRDLEFWRSAPFAERDTVRKSWLEKLDGF